MPTESTPSKSDDDFFGSKKTLMLPDGLRNELKNPLGEVVLEEDLARVLGDALIVVSVGDLCSLTLFKREIIPHIAVVDFATRRGPLDELRAKIRKIGKTVINVNNPPGVITRDLWEAIDKAFREQESVRIEVTGEEDLATLPCVWLAPEGTMVVYGLPDIGLVVVTDLPKAKIMVKNVLTKMV